MEGGQTPRGEAPRLVGHAGIQQPTKAPAQAARPPSQPQKDLFTAALPSFQPLRASTAPGMAFGLSPAPAATPEAGEGAAPWTAGAGGPPAGAAPADTPDAGQGPLLAPLGLTPAGPPGAAAPPAQQRRGEEQPGQQPHQQPQQQKQQHHPNPASAPVESEAAEVLALLAGEGCEASGAVSGTVAVGPAAAGQPGGTLPARVARRPAAADIGEVPHTATPAAAASKGYSLNSRVGQATVSVLDYIRRHQGYYLENGGTGVPERMLRQTFGNNPDTSKALRFLVAENRIIRSGLGGRKDPFSYVLAPGTAEASAPLAAQPPGGRGSAASRAAAAAADAAAAAHARAAATAGEGGERPQAGAVPSRQGSGVGSVAEQRQAPPSVLRGATKRKPQRPAAATSLEQPLQPPPWAQSQRHEQQQQQQQQSPGEGTPMASSADGGEGAELGSGRRRRRPSTKAQENADAEQLLEQLERPSPGLGITIKSARKRAAPSPMAGGAAAGASFVATDGEAEASSSHLGEDGSRQHSAGGKRARSAAGAAGGSLSVGGAAAPLTTPSPAAGALPAGMMHPAAAMTPAAMMYSPLMHMGPMGCMVPTPSGVPMFPTPTPASGAAAAAPAAERTASGAAPALSPEQQQQQALWQMQMQAHATQMAFMQMQWMQFQHMQMQAAAAGQPPAFAGASAAAQQSQQPHEQPEAGEQQLAAMEPAAPLKHEADAEQQTDAAAVAQTAVPFEQEQA